MHVSRGLHFFFVCVCVCAFVCLCVCDACCRSDARVSWLGHHSTHGMLSIPLLSTPTIIYTRYYLNPLLSTPTIIYTHYYLHPLLSTPTIIYSHCHLNPASSTLTMIYWASSWRHVKRLILDSLPVALRNSVIHL